MVHGGRLSRGVGDEESACTMGVVSFCTLCPIALAVASWLRLVVARGTRDH